MNRKIFFNIVFAFFAIIWWDDAYCQTYFSDTTCQGVRYTEHGFDITPTSPGYIYDTLFLTTTTGEDSLVYLELYVGRTYSYTKRKSICEGNNFTEFGFYIINPPVGYHEYDTTYYTVCGCDSSYHLKLTVNPSYNIFHEDTICHGESYHKYGFDYDTPDVGIHEDTHSFISWFECDSIISLRLHVGPTDTVELWDTTCFNQGYHKHGIDTTDIAVGDHFLPIYTTNSFGCDSTVYIHLHVKVSYNTTYNESICYGESYTEHGFYYVNPAVGVYDSVRPYNTTEGCDSIISLHLTVNPVYDITFTDTILYGESYYEHGYIIIDPSPGWTYDNHYGQTAAGCDSTTHLHLYVAQVYDTIIYDTICQGQDYHKYNFDTVNPSPGLVIMQQQLQTVHGFDSIVTLHLSVGALYDIRINDTICDGESYHQHGFHFDSPDIGLHRDSLFFNSIYHCDSTLRLTLCVAPKFDTTFCDTICYGEDYKLHGFNITQPDQGEHTYVNTYPSQCHCDSIVQLNLYVKVSYDIHFFEKICYGEDYHGHGFDTIHPDPGLCIIQHQFKTDEDCDSLVTLNLTVVELFDIKFHDTICEGESYVQNGFTYIMPEVGDYKDSLFLQSVSGCDSTVRLWLNVSPVYDTLFFDTICEFDNYNRHGFHLTNVAPEGQHEYQKILMTIYGCDSIIQLKLWVRNTFDTTFYDTICYGEDYHEHGFDTIKPAAGLCEIRHVFETGGPCDSIVVLKLTVGETYNDIRFFDTICYGDSYERYGFYFDHPEVGDHKDSLFLQTVLGCDSTIRLWLNVSPVFDTLFTDTICDNEEYHKHGFHLANLPTGKHYDTLYLYTGVHCDSVVRLELLVNPTFDTLFTDTICFGESYHEHGFNFDTPNVGWHNDTLDLSTVNGCDSTVRLVLYVAPIYDTLFTDRICFGEEYHLHGFNLDSLGVGWHHDTLNLSTIFGCDSTVRLNLLVNPTFDTLFTDSICFGEDYHQHGFDFDNPPVGWIIEAQPLSTVYGCDSIVRLELYVAPLHDTLFIDGICLGEDYHKHGFHFDKPGVGLHYDTLNMSSVYGCDSMVRLELYVTPSYDTLFTDSTCTGEGYHLHGFHLDSLDVGWHYDTLSFTSVFGCDSMVRLNLWVNPTFDTLFTDTICFGEGYHQHGFDFDNLPVGWKFDTLSMTTVWDCDSIVRLMLYVAPIYDTLFTDTICFGEDYHEHGFHFDRPDIGLYYDTLNQSTVYGCDSTVRLILNVAPLYDTLFIDSICFGEGYHQHGFNLDSLDIGWHYDTLNFPLPSGCDSVVRLSLLVNPTFDTLFTDNICFGEGYHNHGFDFDSLPVGWKFDTLNLTTVLGCDSIVRLELYVAPLYDTLFEDIICYGDGYHEHGFDFDSLPVGWHADTLYLASAFGCDSTVALNLYVAPLYDTLFTDSICFGDGYYEHGFYLDNPNVGWNYDTLDLSTVLGCDSVVRLNLWVNPTFDTLFTENICFGESYHQHGFNFNNPPVGWINETQMLSTIYGCDSVVQLQLYVAPVYDTIFRDTICFGESYHEHNFHLDEPAVGTYNKTQPLSTIFGCDSIVRLKLIVAPIYSYDVFDSICEGEYYTDYGLNYLAAEPGMNYIDSELETTTGCDSIYHVTLKVEHTFQNPEEIHGDEEIFVTTNIVTGFYTYSVDTIPGCTEYIWRIKGSNWYIKPDFNKCEVQARTVGTANLRVIAKNRCGVASQSIDIKAKFVGTGVDEDNVALISIYPNPCKEYVNIEGNDIEEVILYHQTGIIVKSGKYDHEKKVTLYLDDIVNSLYVIEVVTSEGRFIQRISVTNNY